MNKVTYQVATALLDEGLVGVVPTDTLYGLIAGVDNVDAIEHVYRLKRRDSDRPCIVLIDDVKRLDHFNVVPNDRELEMLKDLWPGPNSVIFKAERAPEYLTRQTDTLAFRVPADEVLRRFLRDTGPIIAPSANLENMRPATSIEEAYLYFGEEVFYVDGGERTGPASRLVKIEREKVIVIR